ncbi:PAS domain-containing protein [Pyruvatibacter sp.]|nr:PAS domain-containing protein [Alphaproteobacteria bacterium]
MSAVAAESRQSPSNTLECYEPALALSDAPDRLREFLQIYEDVRGDKVAPTRSDLDLRRLAKLLPDVTIMERLAPMSVIYRLMGTAVAERMGADLTGHNFLNYLGQTERSRIDLGVSIVTELPCGTFSVYENDYSSGVTVRAESIALPLDTGSGCAPYLSLGLHSSQTPVSYGQEREESMIGTRWKDGVVIDLGYGLPDQATMDALKIEDDGTN